MTQVQPQRFSFARDSDKFVITNKNLTKSILEVSKDGVVTENYKPYFKACLNQTLPDQTISGQSTRVVPNWIIDNVGNHFNESGYFKAPEAGVYYFIARVLFTDLLDVKTEQEVSVKFEGLSHPRKDMSYDSLPRTISVYVTEFMEKGALAWVEASASVQSLSVNQAAGFGGSNTSCLTSISGGLL